MKRLLAAGALAGLLAMPAAAGVTQRDPVAPIGPGPFPVACSNVEQDFSRVRPDEEALDYWEGDPRGDEPRYVTQLLVDPANVPQVAVTLPDDRDVFPNRAGRTFPYVLLVCYPTDSTNARADYPLPNGLSVPRMQRGADAPIWPETLAAARWPVLVYAHGLNGSPLGDDYLPTLVEFAKHGYVVVAPFFADPRFAKLDIDDLGDALELIANLSDAVEMQASRPVAISRALDTLLAHPHYRDHVDAARIGGWGASLGGQALVLAAGAKLTIDIDKDSKQVVADPRLKALALYIPYFGQKPLPAFGDDQSGLDEASIAVLAIGGTNDEIAPIGMIEQGVNRMRGPRYLVEFNGAAHGIEPVNIPDIYTWSLTFLEAYLADNPTARARIASMTEVEGGASDRTRIDVTFPLPAVGDEAVVIEYYNPALDHFFVTAFPEEAAMLDAGELVPGWSRTELEFKQFRAGAAEGERVCRFFGTPGVGPNSHFYTAYAEECARVQANPNWTFEAHAFQSALPLAERCAGGRVPVWRIYNNGLGGQANHRYTTSRSTVDEMERAGWLLEGAVFCAAP
jgi:predicted dienelactone hydrolase